MKRLIVIAIAATALAGCGENQHGDLQRELVELTKDVKGKVEPLPELRPYQPVPYTAFDQADPFGPAKIKLLNPQKVDSTTPGPDLTRIKEPLEAYPLESLRMVGTLFKDKSRFALVRADGGVFRVRVGNYLGQNFGVITRITDGEISLKELIQDGTGDWAERVSSLLLQEAEGKK